MYSSSAGTQFWMTSVRFGSAFRMCCFRNFGRVSLTSSILSKSQEMEYDYIVVGAGSAGCVLANRLTSPGHTVCLIEAGPRDYTWTIHMPAALMYNLCHDKYNWYYHTEPQPMLNNIPMYTPRGRVWGGSSSLNAMVYIRGHPFDYDRWEREGATGWSYADCLPYFKRSQTHELGPDTYRGGDGPLHVSRGKTEHPLHEAFLEACQQAGYPYTPDMNGYMQEGFGPMDMTIYKGRRWSAASAYLRPAMKRKNLVTMERTFVNRIIFEGLKAVGVEAEGRNGVKMKLRANKEVILSGGCINSPQLLMLSGIGDADHLRQFDIPVLQHLPGVGQNLQDHLELHVQQRCKKPITLYSAQWKFPHKMTAIGLEWFIKQTGWGATTHLETGGFIRSEAGVEHPDLQFHFLPSTVHDHGRQMGSCHSYQVHVGPMRSASVGFVKLRSANPREHPIIEPHYMTAERDFREMRAGVRLSREIFAQPAFDEFRHSELAPGADATSDAQIDAYIRANSATAYHPSCTVRMGGDDAPLDPQCRVRGVENLRVIDSSAMPSIVSGNLNGPTIMLAEKAADHVLGKVPLARINAPVWTPKHADRQREVSE